jgi:hypothetical protein
MENDVFVSTRCFTKKWPSLIFFWNLNPHIFLAHVL